MALEYKGGRCERCGYNRCLEALEFHHISSSEKDFSVSSRGYTRSWKRVREELDKCILLCANCHREIHAQVSSSRRKLRDGKASKFRETLQSKGNPEPSPEPEHSEWFGEGAETRHSLPKSEKDMVKV